MYNYVHNNIISSRHPHMSMNTHSTEEDYDPCTWQHITPVSVEAPIPKFSSKVKYGYDSQLGAQ